MQLRCSLDAATAPIAPSVAVAPTVAVDLSFGELMNAREQRSLRAQLVRVYGNNRKHRAPLALHYTALGNAPAECLPPPEHLRVWAGGADLTLLELCAFSIVATSVEKNFPDEAPSVRDARAVLSSPTPEQRIWYTGTEADLNEFFYWIDAGKPADGVRRGPQSEQSVA